MVKNRKDNQSIIDRVKRESDLALCIKTIVKYSSKDYVFESIRVEGNKIYFTDEFNKKLYVISVSEL